MFLGILSLLAASLLFGTIPTINKFLLSSGIRSEHIVFYMYLTVTFISGVMLLLKGQSFKVTKRQLITSFFLGAFGLGMTAYMLNFSYNLIPVGLATMLHFSYPCFVGIAMVLLFGEKLTKVRVCAILSSTIGMALIADFTGGIHWFGIVLALCSGITYAGYIIANDKGTINALPLLLKIFYTAIGPMIVFGLLSFGKMTLPGKGSVCLLLFGGCGIGTLLAIYFLTYGIKKVGAVTASFFNMLEPIVSLIVSTLVYRDILSKRAILGCFFAFLSVLLVAVSSHTRTALKHSPENSFENKQS